MSKEFLEKELSFVSIPDTIFKDSNVDESEKRLYKTLLLVACGANPYIRDYERTTTIIKFAEEVYKDLYTVKKKLSCYFDKFIRLGLIKSYHHYIEDHPINDHKYEQISFYKIDFGEVNKMLIFGTANVFYAMYKTYGSYNSNVMNEKQKEYANGDFFRITTGDYINFKKHCFRTDSELLLFPIPICYQIKPIETAIYTIYQYGKLIESIDGRDRLKITYAEAIYMIQFKTGLSFRECYKLFDAIVRKRILVIGYLTADRRLGYMCSIDLVKLYKEIGKHDKVNNCLYIPG